MTYVEDGELWGREGRRRRRRRRRGFHNTVMTRR
jgi:hypothetical protein